MSPALRSLVALLLCLTSIAHAADNKAIVALNANLQSMHTMKANFSQRMEDDQGVLLQQANGNMAVKRPRRLLWKTLTPYEHLMVTDGTTLWLYDIDLEQITRRPFTKDLDKAPALLLSGEINEIADQYSIEHQVGEGGINTFHLTPLDSQQLFQSMTIIFKAGVIQSMLLKDNFSQQTVIEFSDVKLNAEIPASLFDFTPPVGVDVMSAQ
jgi:outer membrane lipoprotein carrier protein